ncbi:MAG: hypothetical protein HZA22_04375 [Nitrospirae bacterium]|nr:hypothetical protein [Nitrospirota bacterium]
MPLDVAVLDDQYRYKKHMHIDKAIHGTLFKKIVTTADYPSLGLAHDESEDITIAPDMVADLAADIDRLEAYLKAEAPMSEEVKARCLAFTAALKDICAVAMAEGRAVEFVAGE